MKVHLTRILTLSRVYSLYCEGETRIGSLKQKYSRLSEVSQLWYRHARLCSLSGRYEIS
jgi:hypothetical protein